MRLMNFGAATGCHQRAERSFFINGYQLPLCARCTGVWFGQLAALVLSFFITPSFWSGLFLLPLAVDGLTQAAGWRTSNNGLRLATGLLGGYANASVLIAFVLLVYHAVV